MPEQPQTETPGQFEARLYNVLERRYHNLHPFSVRLHTGECTKEEVRRWITNRYYYQTRIPLKDTRIINKAAAREEDRTLHNNWRRRVSDHEGSAHSEGGLSLWLRLGEAAGLPREETRALRRVLPGVRRACDAYVEFVETRTLLEGVAASLTEIKAGPHLGARAEAFRRHYPWLEARGLAYFLARTKQAPRDAEEALAYVRARANTRALQNACVAAVARKCEILWALLDGVEWGGKRPRLSAAARLQQRGAGESFAVLPERAVLLGGAAPEILALCNGARDNEAVAALLRAAHPQAPADLEQQVFAFIENMHAAGVLEWRP